MLTLLRQVSLGELRERWGRALLVVMAIALGVAMITAIGISNDSVLRRFGSALERMAGRADLQITFGTGETGFAEAIVDDVRAHPAVAQAVALVRGALAFTDGSDEVLELFGVDFLGEDVLAFYDTAVRERTKDPLVILTDPHSLFITEKLAQRRHLSLGDPIDLESPTGVHRHTIHGIVAQHGLAAAYGGQVAVMDLPAAQRVLGRTAPTRGGNVDQIDVRVRPDVPVKDAAAQLRAALPPTFAVAAPWQRRQQYERTFAGLRATLTGVSTLALLAAIFIVYSTTATLLTYRMPAMATLLTLGASARRLTRVVLVEAAILGTVGAFLGVGLGIVMAFFTVEDIATGMRLNYSLSFEGGTPIVTSWKGLLVYPLIGALASVAAAVLPARWIRQIDPLELLRAEAREKIMVTVSSRILFVVAAGVGATAVGALVFGVRSQSAVLCSLGAILISLSAAVLVLPTVRGLWGGLRQPLERTAGMEGRLAAESLNRSVERTGVAVAAIALSMSVAVAAAALARSFRASVVDWYALTGDVAVSARRTQGWLSVPVAGDLQEVLSGLASVASVETLRIAQGQHYAGTRIAVVAATDGFFRELPAHGGGFGSQAADTALETLRRGDGVVVSENFVTHFGVAIGNEVDVPSPHGPLRRPVVGVVPDYASDRGAIVISRDLYRAHWNDTLVNYFMLTLADGASAADVRRDMQQALGERETLSVMEIAALRTSVDAIVREAFADMDAIQFLVLVIALAGILDLLITNTLDRTRELAIWRFLGAVDRAVVRSLVFEALAMATAAVVFGLIVGVVLAWVWIRFSYPALVGYVLQFHFPWATSLLCVGLALGVAAVSGRLAATIAVRHPILEGLLHE